MSKSPVAPVAPVARPLFAVTGAAPVAVRTGVRAGRSAAEQHNK